MNKTPHIEVDQVGHPAETVLLPGDPLKAEFTKKNVSDSLVSREETTSEEREGAFTQMLAIILELV